MRSVRLMTFISLLRREQLALGAAGDDVAWRVEGLDVDRMRACAQRFIGEHDFKVFSAGGKASGTTVRTIRAAVVEELEHVDLPFVGRVRGPLVAAVAGAPAGAGRWCAAACARRLVRIPR